MYSICTDRPVLDTKELKKKRLELSLKVQEKEGVPYSEELLDVYCETAGLKTISRSFKAYLEKYNRHLEDDLPKGAKSHLQEVWLKENLGFTRVYSNGEGDQLIKGQQQEDGAIEVLNKHLGSIYMKNTERVAKGFLSGECDLVGSPVSFFPSETKIIRDIKVPEDWTSFRSKRGIPKVYEWQLISYLYLYDAQGGWIDYVLMPDPPDVVKNKVRYMDEVSKIKYYAMQETIEELPPSQRVKSFKLDVSNLESDIEFLKARLEKAQEYYENLTYEECMNFKYTR